MKNIYIHLLLLVTGIALSLNMHSQNYVVHDFSVYGGAGLNTLQYDVKSPFESKNGSGALFGVDYTYSFNPNMGMMLGAEMSFYRGKVKNNNFSDSYMTYDIDNSYFEYRLADGKDLEDIHSATYINIPIKMRYQSLGTVKFYGAGGIKFGIPIHSKSKIKLSSITASGFYPDDNQTYTDSPFMGFGTFNNISNNVISKLKIAFLLSLEAGAKYAITDQNNLYGGIYFDYGLNDIKKNETRLINYDAISPQEIVVQNISSVQLNKDGETIRITKKVIPMAIGLKVGVSFGL